MKTRVGRLLVAPSSHLMVRPKLAGSTRRERLPNKMRLWQY
jgi:hypothetical protein